MELSGSVYVASTDTEPIYGILLTSQAVEMLGRSVDIYTDAVLMLYKLQIYL
jgi:hypothetical protein